MAQWVKNPPTMQETGVRSPSGEDTLEEGMATLSSILAWRTHGQGSLVGYSLEGHKESDMCEHTQYTANNNNSAGVPRAHSCV